MHRDDVGDGAQEERHHEGHVRYVPKRKQFVKKRKLRVSLV